MGPLHVPWQCKQKVEQDPGLSGKEDFVAGRTRLQNPRAQRFGKDSWHREEKQQNLLSRNENGWLRGKYLVARKVQSM